MISIYIYEAAPGSERFLHFVLKGTPYERTSPLFLQLRVSERETKEQEEPEHYLLTALFYLSECCSVNISVWNYVENKREPKNNDAGCCITRHFDVRNKRRCRRQPRTRLTRGRNLPRSKCNVTNVKAAPVAAVVARCCCGCCCCKCAATNLASRSARRAPREFLLPALRCTGHKGHPFPLVPRKYVRLTQSDLTLVERRLQSVLLIKKVFRILLPNESPRCFFFFPTVKNFISCTIKAYEIYLDCAHARVTF